MGNMNMYATAAAAAAAEVVFVSSLVSDLQARVQAFVDALILAGDRQIVDVNISGAGDGYAFMVSVLTREGGTPPVAGTLVRFYEAASAPELQVASAAAIASIAAVSPVLQITGHGESGSSMGHRWMGILVAEPVPI